MDKNTKMIDSKKKGNIQYELIKWVVDNIFVIYSMDRKEERNDIASRNEVKRFNDLQKAREYFKNI